MDQLGFSLYLITDRAAAPRPPADVVEECLAAGLRAVQLREKDLEARDLLALADTLRESTRRHGARLIVNDRADVALAAGADGVQRTHASLPVPALRAITPPGFLVGASVHSVAEARGRRAEGADFIVFGPVYDTASKRRYGPPQGLASARGGCPRGGPPGAGGGRAHAGARARGARGRRGGRRGDRRDLRRRAPRGRHEGVPRRAGASLMAAPAVVVVGGGIIGCATAADLAKRGLPRDALRAREPGRRGLERGGGAAGAARRLPEPGPFHRLAIESWRLYPGVASELRDADRRGRRAHDRGHALPAATRPREIEAARLRLAWPLAGEFGIEVVEGSDLRALEPALSKDVRAALFVRGDHWVNNQRLVTAYAAAAAARGVTVRTGAEVSRILIEGGRARGVLVDGEAVHADAVLLAAGAWSGPLAASSASGCRWRRCAARCWRSAMSPPLITRAVHGDDIYVVPRPSGEILIGATVEHAGFLRAVTPDGLGRPHRRRGRASCPRSAAAGHPLLVRLPALGARRPAGARARGRTSRASSRPPRTTATAS